MLTNIGTSTLCTMLKPLCWYCTSLSIGINISTCNQQRDSLFVGVTMFCICAVSLKKVQTKMARQNLWSLSPTALFSQQKHCPMQITKCLMSAKNGHVVAATYMASKDVVCALHQHSLVWPHVTCNSLTSDANIGARYHQIFHDCLLCSSVQMRSLSDMSGSVIRLSSFM